MIVQNMLLSSQIKSSNALQYVNILKLRYIGNIYIFGWIHFERIFTNFFETDLSKHCATTLNFNTATNGTVLCPQ